MSGAFERASQELRNRFSAYLTTLPQPQAPEGFQSACDYVLGSGGKFVRPLLVYHAGRAVSPNVSLTTLDTPAAAVELIHIYSLVHDDLPAMDDDDLRRGKPTLHTAYDEATAILVGDGLQAQAFELLATAPGMTDEQRVAMVRELAQAAGASGMVGGQYIDIRATDSSLELADLRNMHSLKTGAMIRAALALGGIAAGASEQQLSALDEYGSHVGLAFQVVDDILDVEGDAEKLGKTRGKDGEANKPTYVQLLGLEGARSESHRLLREALSSLDAFKGDADALREMAEYVVARTH